MRLRKNKGFSLIELIIVIAILAIVLAIAAPNFMAYRDNSNLKEATRDISSDIQLYKQRAVSENKQYRMVFNVGGNNYTVQSSDGGGGWVNVATKSVGAGYGGIIITGDPTFTDDTITFATRGTTTNGTLALEHATRHSTAQIVTSTMGRVRVDYVLK